MYGLDYLGLGSRHWPVKRSLRQFPRGWALGTFDTTFGPALPKIKRFLRSGKVKALKVHIWWHNDHRICPLKVLKRRLPAYEKLAKQFPTIPIYISHSCEYRERNKALVRKRVQMIHKLAPNCIPLNTPWIGVPTAGTLTERHGVTEPLKGANFWSADGSELNASNCSAFHAKHRDVDILFGWGALFNFRCPGFHPDPKKRKCEIPAAYFKKIIRHTKGEP